MIPVIILKVNVFVRLIVSAETWALCNGDKVLPEHVEAACEGIAQAILQALVWSM